MGNRGYRSILTVAAATATAESPPRTLRVLYVGNSQMFYYDLPTMISLMADSAPPSNARIEAGKALVGGASLKKHWDTEGKGSVRELLATQHWDYVVLQELFSAKAPEFEDYAAKLHEAIRKADSNTIIFATASVTEAYSGGYKYPDSFKALNDMQISFAKKNKIAVAAAGYAWMRYLGDNPTEAQRLDLYHADKGHPGGKGSYIYACLLYAVITGKSPEGLISEFPNIRGGVVIPKEEAARMQKAAWDEYLESLK